MRASRLEHRQRIAVSTLPLALLLAPLFSGCPGPEVGDPDAGRLDGGDASGPSPSTDAALLDAPATTHPDDAPVRLVAFTRSDAVFANPERGFYRAVELLDETELGWLRSEHPNDTLLYSYVMLDRFRDRDLDAAMLTRIRAALELVRREGFEVVLRFAYNLGPYPDSEPDAPLARIQRHVAELAPILEENADVIALVQAGFIGAWGEWHTSTNGLDRDPAARRAVVEALLDALPSSRATQVRYPPYIAELVGGSPLDRAHAWDGSFASRVGFHNDCFVSSETDVGTYPDGEIERWKTFMDAHSAFVPVGGETCEPDPPRSGCESTLREMERHHYSFINRDYHPSIVRGWETGGCMEEMERRLGYRLVLLEATLPERVRPGGSFTLTVRLTNEGFAAPFNPRPVELVLRAGSHVERVALEGVEVRSWLAGEAQTLTARVRLPASLEEGDATLALRLPSAEPALAERSSYSIRLANEATWDGATGENRLGTIAIDEAAPGSSDPSAGELAILP